ncbi:uncharacterized protein LOC116413029 [Galleria mellonella]|uniref:Uncharacterized protein LOC116413029 n=1 Tax=Galleria mellonella TaxID=7137 RepID=A0ABM3N7L3_GALME|nr:uncharacterized protein LOC116413029 [Galleria mellonella]
MPPDMSLSMRHTKIKAEEAALLAGEISKPSWESRNEGIHERVSFEDAIWGFDLAGGAYYKTPLRVTHVKPDSRAQKAGIRPGDKLIRINDIDTSTLTIQEAHKIIIESGIHLKLAVTAPEDEEDSYYCYQDPLEDGYDSEEERRLEEEKALKRQVHAKVSSYWSLQWPWVSKRRVIYRESNCFMVPSKYEDKHKEKFPEQPALRMDNSVVFDTAKPRKEKKRVDIEEVVEENGVKEHKPIKNQRSVPNLDVNNNKQNMTNGVNNVKSNGHLGGISEEEEVGEEDKNNRINSKDDELSLDESLNGDAEEVSLNNDNTSSNDDKVINDLLNGTEHDANDEDKILDNILSDNEEHNEADTVER